MWTQDVGRNQLQQISIVQQEQDRPEDRPLWDPEQDRGQRRSHPAASNILATTVEI